MENDLIERLFRFSVEVIVFLRDIKNNQETGIIKYQLIKASTSSGANYSPGQIA